MNDFKYYILYKITCIENNKIYIGQHRTNNLNDNYLGSGSKTIKDDIKKFGKQKFKKEILFFCKNREELNKLEKLIVNKEFVLREDVYNIAQGGSCGGTWNPKKAGEVFSKKLENEEFYKWWYEQTFSEENKKIRAEACSKSLKEKYLVEEFHWTNKKHKKETKEKIGKANAVSQKGERNSNFGNCWIYNLEKKENRRIPKKELQKWLKDSWIKGRKMKF